MEQRQLGRTGVSVSKLCLGAMMFGDWGTKDHDESIRIIHRALDAGINFVDTANRFDMSLPENQRKLDAAEQLAELAEQSGLTLIQLAIAFVLRHPAVTAAIIGPRTMDHLESQLTAADVQLSDDVLDRIDKIVPPGINLNPADGGWVSPALEPAARRG
jgi:aryl-alcohol dehydrogenase-like predicted oxidoreductase